jgi:aspartyl-tRNA(Asn)/glutamyl-tRNA(Gln) amidotransferase subunit B
VPLIEIVSDPDLCNSDEAYAYLTEIRKLVRYLEICDGNMEEGSLRCDANISVMPVGTTKYGNRVEVKNMNSFKNVQRAIEHEIDRQIAIVEAGGVVSSETRMFDATNGETYSLRSKESLNDYRYFPEPDLQPIVVSDEWLRDIKAQMPSLPAELFEKFTQKFGLSEYDANVLTDAKEIALYFDEVCKNTTNYKGAANWVTGAVKSFLNERTLHISAFTISAERLASLITLIDSGKISHTVASQKIFPAMLESSQSPMEIAEALNVLQEGDADSLAPIIAEIVAKYPQKVAEYKGGKKGLLGMFMGELMKATKGKADPKMANQLMEDALNNA